jgi:hypothetical protein
MGLVRKTLSIGTLGLVSFRSKKELLRRAETDLEAANAELERERLARDLAEGRISGAERRTRQAELETLAAAKQAAKLRGKKGKHARTLAERLSDAIDTADSKVQAGAEEAKVRGRRARKKAAKAAKEAKARSTKTAEEAKVRGRKAAKEAKVRSSKATKQAKAALEDAKARADEYLEKVTSDA